MEKPELKVVGEIKPPEYKNPSLMLRNLADSIDAGDYGDVETVALVLVSDRGYDVFGGGRRSDMESCAFAFSAAATRFYMLPWKTKDSAL